jgi:hypothetical protein
MAEPKKITVDKKNIWALVIQLLRSNHYKESHKIHHQSLNLMMEIIMAVDKSSSSNNNNSNSMKI